MAIRKFLIGFIALFVVTIACVGGGVEPNIQETVDAAVQGSQEASSGNAPTAVSTSTVLSSITPEPIITETLLPSPSPVANRDLISLVPFDYTLKDAGDGWMDGSVTLAFENKTKKAIILENLVFDFKNGILLETNEGTTYPITLVQETSIGIETTQLYFGRMIIPPGFRFYRETFGPGTWFYLYWQSAVAATPKRITFPDYPELDFDLPASQETNLEFPFTSAPATIDSIAGLEGSVLVNNPQGVISTFTGRCGDVFFFNPGADPFYDDWLIEFTSTNNDAFQEQTGVYDFTVSAFSRTGDITFGNVYYKYDLNTGTSGYFQEIVLGPGQNQTGYLVISGPLYYPIYHNLPPIVVKWVNENSYKVYDLSECGSGR